MFDWADRLNYYRMGCSWGGYESLVIVLGNPAEYGSRSCVDGESTLVRLYSGLEEPSDLIADLEQAFETLDKEFK